MQQSNAVESLNNVDVLCMDKTGTLMANRMLLDDIAPLNCTPKDDMSAVLGTFARSTSATNTTSEAILAGTDGQHVKPTDEVLFSSAHNWSALAFDDGTHIGTHTGTHTGTYVLGAVEMLEPYLASQVSDPLGCFGCIRQQFIWRTDFMAREWQ